MSPDQTACLLGASPALLLVAAFVASKAARAALAALDRALAWANANSEAVTVLLVAPMAGAVAGLLRRVL